MKNSFQYLAYLSLILFFVSCEDTPESPIVLHGDAFGTTYSIQYYPKTSFDAEKGIDSVIYAVNKSVSTYLPNSDISKINAGDSSMVVDAIFKDVFLISEEVHKKSFGYFDPTVGVLRNAYGFGDAAPISEIDKATLDSLMKFVGFQKVKLLSDGRISKEHPEIYFDFNAVAKGYGIDLIGAYLQKNGVDNFLIELGGEILARGKNLSKNESWVVGVESVDSDLQNRKITKALHLKNKAMASSGNYRKFRIDSVTGKKYVHTINPLSGSAMQSDVTSATVIANSCALADAYATAFMALGLERSKEVLGSLPELDAYLTYSDSIGTHQSFITKGFSALLLD
ncbi:FAD:protein FMN transferase [Constantimarinum furrinae]|uniref:FAD:protein FMN transferase n=1 Tax=Constantimarinum furrinae TaxID=2562285 RepID=A0A7G8PRB2_9FLAO|nr:FAD:protein FMN transferase [Constantimarinum furrinae]QNJ96878.1 FAD:protein FMN transferase [Constantimarinum furrinae]